MQAAGSLGYSIFGLPRERTHTWSTRCRWRSGCDQMQQLCVPYCKPALRSLPRISRQRSFRDWHVSKKNVETWWVCELERVDWWDTTFICMHDRAKGTPRFSYSVPQTTGRGWWRWTNMLASGAPIPSRWSGDGCPSVHVWWKAFPNSPFGSSSGSSWLVPVIDFAAQR